jgi:hypothetical protein
MACNLHTITLTGVCTLDIQNCDGINTSITFTPNETGTPQDFAFCAISYDEENPCTVESVDVIGECTCNCYLIYSEEEVQPTIKYVDCNNNIIDYTLINDGVYLPSLKVCSKGIIVSTGCTVVDFGDCNGAPCHIQDCQCYTIPAGNDSDVYYLDCAGGLLNYKDGVSEEPYSFCAQAIVGVSGAPLQQLYPCFNGECLTGATDILLYDLIKLSGPCPDICSGVTPVGGPAGTSTIDINTGYPI